MIKWLVTPRLSYLDSAVLGVSWGLFGSIGWWSVGVALVGVTLSTALEMHVRAA